jgi:CRP-like cAMP-binding protein
MLLNCMQQADVALIAPFCQRRRLSRGTILCEAAQPAEALYFVEYGVASIVTAYPEGRATEIALVGRETFIGIPIVTGDGRWPYRTFVQTDQLCVVCLPYAAAMAALNRSPSFLAVLLRSVQATIVQVAEALVSASWQRLDGRLARWLLMYRDRLQSDRIEVTHELMALMVGAQRTGITATLHNLEDLGLITAARGLVVIRDAERLKRIAERGYGIAESEYARLLGADF